jgi:2-methylcitrate dehydratase PrpD
MLDELNTRTQHVELVERLVSFVDELNYDTIEKGAIEAAKIFLMDTIAVGIAGTTYDATDKALKAAMSWGESGNTRVIGRPNTRLSKTSAAFVNGIQTHALEWDGLHEHSVVIALCAPVSALMAEIEHNTIDGKSLLVALIAAVEVAVFFGGDTSSSPRFFRPSAAGVMGATMGLAKLRNFDKNQMMNALGLAYSQASGTMQAHWEGSMALPMQVGVAARTAHMSVDMVEAGMTGPVDVINGRFGYFQLFESGGDINHLLNTLGQPLKMTEMAHKPYPAGRATQATLTMINTLRAQHDFDHRNIERIDIHIPPLVLLLVGRPITADMTPSYARLCLRFVAPLMIIDGDIDPRRYTAEAFCDQAINALSAKMHIHHDGNEDKNALGPQTMTILLKDGTQLNANCTDPLGSPNNPLSKVQREAKVKRCFSLGLQNQGADEFIQACSTMTEITDCKVLVDFATAQ